MMFDALFFGAFCPTVTLVGGKLPEYRGAIMLRELIIPHRFIQRVALIETNTNCLGSLRGRPKLAKLILRIENFSSTFSVHDSMTWSDH